MEAIIEKLTWLSWETTTTYFYIIYLHNLKMGQTRRLRAIADTQRQLKVGLQATLGAYLQTISNARSELLFLLQPEATESTYVSAG